MHTDYQTTTIDPEITPYGKIFGVVKYRYQLKRLCESLAAIEVREVEILDGRPGLQQLQAWQENFSHYFLGQREADLLSHYLDAVRNDFIVFTAVVPAGGENTTAELAKSRGATRLSHFGDFVVTSY
jgi:hypothetical protein